MRKRRSGSNREKGLIRSQSTQIQIIQSFAGSSFDSWRLRAMADVVSPILSLLVQRLSSPIWKIARSSEAKELKELKELLSGIASVVEEAERRSLEEEIIWGLLKRLKDVAFEAEVVVDVLEDVYRERGEVQPEREGKHKLQRDWMSTEELERICSRINGIFKWIANELGEASTSKMSQPKRLAAFASKQDLSKYIEMPPPARRCFAYMSLFPKGYCFNRLELIRLWIAEGFVVKSKGFDEELEDIADSYFSHMVKKKIFNDVKWDEHGDVVSCKIDNMYELVQLVSTEESYILDLGIHAKKVHVPRRCYYLSIIPGFQPPTVVDAHYEARKLRSLLVMSGMSKGKLPRIVGEILPYATCLQTLRLGGYEVSSYLLRRCNLRHLRFLDLSNSKVKSLDDYLADSYHLEFLDLSNTKIEVLPLSICTLRNLRMLSVRECHKLSNLPAGFGALPNLRSLDLSYTKIHSLPGEIGELRNLQELNLSCIELGGLPTEFGELVNLRSLDLSETKIHSLPGGIVKLYNLQKLKLKSCVELGGLPSTIDRLTNLRLLDLSYSGIRALPDSVTTLVKLEVLDLRGCVGLRELPQGMKNMGKLVKLFLSGCDLIRIPYGLGKLDSLQQLLDLNVHVTEDSRHVLSELKDLDCLRGKLRITGLCKLDDAQAAAGAELAAKTGLESLELLWRTEPVREWEKAEVDWVAGSSPSSRATKDVEILEKLRPNQNLKHLSIEDYAGSRFPTWLTHSALNDWMSSSSFPGLRSFSLYNLERCVSLPPLADLCPHLKRLQIESAHALQTMDNSVGRFLRLKYLQLQYLPELEDWIIPEEKLVFPNLRTLIIVGCPKLRVRSPLPSSLVELELGFVSEELLSDNCLRGLYGLKKLKISNVEAPESGWSGVQHLWNLQQLEVTGCHFTPSSYNTMMRQRLPWLCDLTLTLNSGVKSLGGDDGGKPPLLFSRLEHLKLQGCDELTALPDWLTSVYLRTLELSYCEKLAMLPRQLTGELKLTICGCPELERMDQTKGEEEWRKIAKFE